MEISTSTTLDRLDALAERQAARGEPRRARPHAALHSTFMPWRMQRMQLRDYARGVHTQVVVAGRQVGKALQVDQPVLTPRGWVPIGHLVVGDEVIGGSGARCTVTGVYPQGRRACYEVTFCDGASVVCDEEHLWSVKTHHDVHRGNDWRVMSLREIRDRWGDEPTSDKAVRIPVHAGAEMDAQPVPLDPYLVGALLGDGCLSTGYPRLSNPDASIVDRVERALPDGARMSHYDEIEHGICQGTSDLLERLRALGMLGKRAHEKRIPRCYIDNSIDVRLGVLRGLMDTDGHATASGICTFSSTSHDLATGVAELCRSLGGKAKTRGRQTHYTHNGERRAGRPSWRVTLRMPKYNPFWLKRKRERWRRPVSRADHRVLRSIKPVGVLETVCISVDSNDRTFVTKDHIVTHNTHNAVHLLLLVALERPGSYSILLAPSYLVAQTGIDKIREREGEIPGARWREQKKRFLLPNGSIIQVFSADRPDKAARGPTLTGLFWIDEAAFLSVKARDAALGALTAVADPLKLFTTTPKGKNWVHGEFVTPAPGKATYRVRSADSPYANQVEIAANRARMGKEMAAQEFDAVFVDALLLVFSDPARMFVPVLPKRRDSRQGNVLGIDVAKTSDWTVVTRMNRWGEGAIIRRKQKQGEGKTFYAELLRDVVDLLERYKAVPAIDTANGTGPGEALADMLEDKGYKPIRVKTGQPRVKSKMVERAQVGFERGEIKLLDNEHRDQAVHEFGNFMSLTRTINGTEVRIYEGPQEEGEHDDIPISVCLAYWGVTELDQHGLDVDLRRYVDVSEGRAPAPAQIKPGRAPGVPGGGSWGGYQFG